MAMLTIAVTKARENLLPVDALMRKRDVSLALLEKREKALDPSLVSGKKKFIGVKMKNSYF